MIGELVRFFLSRNEKIEKYKSGTIYPMDGILLCQTHSTFE